MNKLFFIGLLAVVFAFVGCGKKALEPVAVGEMLDYKDPAFGFKIKYPKEWKQLGTTGKALFCKSQEVSSKFTDPRTGEEGAQVIAEVMKFEGKTPADLISDAVDELKQVAQVSPEEQITVAGKPATKVPFAIKVTSKTNITGYDIFVAGDTALYKLEFVGYGEQYNAHAALFDAMQKSFELPVIMAKTSDKWMASPSLETFNNQYFSFQYPDNFTPDNVKKGNFDFSTKMLADQHRLDCSIQFDVFGAKGLTVEKVWDQNKGKFKSKGNGETTIDGLKAIWVEYSPIANIMSRTYFIVKNDKVVRPTISWFSPQRDVYFPAFEKCISSMKFK